MSATTQCPACGTRFRATQAQLEAYHGMVRCGHCHAAFNAIENRTSQEPSPQLDLPIVLEDVSAPEIEPEAAPAFDVTAAAAPELASAEPEPGPWEKPPRVWPWALAAALLLASLLAQAAYLFRVELAARLPGLKPALAAACTRLHCTVPLPRNPDLMSIESSNLETDPAQPGVITLTVTLRNLAPYPQEYPNLELTLTDVSDTPVGRRVLHPADYLKEAADEKTGLAGNREASLRLAIDASGLRAAGYRLFLFY